LIQVNEEKDKIVIEIKEKSFERLSKNKPLLTLLLIHLRDKIWENEN